MRLITDVLRDIRRGRVVDAATLELASVVRDAKATGKPGELTIKLKITPDKADPDVIRVSAEVKGKSPRPDLPDGMFFTNEEGDLLREDPKKIHRFAGVSDAEEVDADGVVTERAAL
jgi:hypothetical protein